MDLELDPASPIPLYRQIADSVKRLIALGAVRPGERLPTVRELATRSRVNRNTAARAIQTLETEGVVRTRVGQGTFVVDGTGRIREAQRHEALDQALDRLIFEARGLGVPLEELADGLARRVAEFRRRQREADRERADAEERA